MERLEYVCSFYTEEPTFCQHCGRAIKNVAELTKEGKPFFVGTSCAETLEGLSISIFQGMEQKKHLAKMRKAYKRAKTTPLRVEHYASHSVVIVDGAPSTWENVVYSGTKSECESIARYGEKSHSTI